jgi:two-component system, OmpR family, phosphate regulon sensor histidine kinase PhoR
MFRSKLCLALPLAACVAWSALALAWLTESAVLGATSAALRAVLLGGSATIAAAIAAVAWRRQQIARHSVQRQLQLLCQIDSHQLAENASGAVPTLDPNDTWRDVFQQVHQALAAYAARAKESELARATAEMRAQRHSQRAEYLEHILSEMPQPIVAVNEFDDVLISNANATQLFGLSEDSTEHRALDQFIRCDELIELLRDTRRRKTLGSRSCELELRGADGTTHWYTATARGFSLGSSESSPHGAVAVLGEIDNLKELQRRNAEFVSSVSHEIKTPLAGIKAYVELLADDEADDDTAREEYLSVINSQADRLQRLVDNLLNLARIEAGVVEVSKQALSLNELLEEALNVVAPSAELRKIVVVSDLSEMYLGVVADRDMILQTAINLLSNAVKYTPEGGTITIRSRLHGHQVQFEVSDNGVGLSAEDCGRVFEKFYRVKKDQKMASGTGLGLPLAKHIIEDVHGGTLSVESTLGKGSTFGVTLIRSIHAPVPGDKEPSSIELAQTAD